MLFNCFGGKERMTGWKKKKRKDEFQQTKNRHSAVTLNWFHSELNVLATLNNAYL